MNLCELTLFRRWNLVRERERARKRKISTALEGPDLFRAEKVQDLQRVGRSDQEMDLASLGNSD